MTQNATDGIQNVLDEYPMFIDESAILYCLILRKFEFDSQFIERNRLIFGKNIIDNYFKARMDKANCDKKKMLIDLKENKINPMEWKRNSYFKIGVSCSIEWPLCIYDTYYKYEITEFFIYRTMEAPKLLENYFFFHIDDNKSNKTFKGSSYNINSNSENFSDIKSKLKINPKNRIISMNEENSQDEEEINPANERENSDCKHFMIPNTSTNFIETKHHKIRETIKYDNSQLLLPTNQETYEIKAKLFENYYEQLDDDYNNINEINKSIDDNVNEHEHHESPNMSRIKVISQNDEGNYLEDITFPFEDLIIERRQHYCNSITHKRFRSKEKYQEKKILTFSEQNSFSSIEFKQRKNNYRNKTGRIVKYKERFMKYKNKKIQNRSFTAFNPYLLINFNKADNQKICSNFISTIRKNFDRSENQFLSISEYNLLENPFSPKEDEFIFTNINENDEV